MKWENISENKEVIELLKEREQIEEKIMALDDSALMMYELEKINT